ncbi:hypothetical protein SEVIR_4G294800v4 [Setaria viridis]|uniref:Uncharacterized protein n=1 Tax=Setaria viridis TaxID=4556 RepID=A0A4U6V5L5_SETVI|nr:putative UPF0496 protein 2 [Setaria viridis]TKW23485.1 hypothetical protein SEVIR_4G294800v2 [Setaria viridis]
MRSSPPSPSSSSTSIFRIEAGDAMERSNSTPSSSTPARLPPRSTLDVDEEYDSAFKSKSFLDLWSHAHRHLSHTFSSSFKQSSSKSGAKDYSRHGDEEDVDTAAALEQSCSYTVLDDFVLEPSPEVLARGRSGRRRRRRRRGVETLLIEYFDVTQEACEACSALLTAIGAARRHHLTLRRLLARLEDGGGGRDGAAARDAVAEHVRLDNPLSAGRLSGFHEVHGRCGPLATRLAAAQRRLRRLARAMRVARGTAAAALVAACAGAIVAAVVFAAHAVVGIGAAAAAVGGASPATAVRWAAERVSERRYARAGAAVDAAARGAYIVGRDLDTVSRMVRRAHDELEHGRDVARIAVRGRGERPLMQEVAREEAECEEDLRAQLEELEEHVCLCLITINRSRRMVAHQMTGGLPPLEATPSQN